MRGELCSLVCKLAARMCKALDLELFSSVQLCCLRLLFNNNNNHNNKDSNKRLLRVLSSCAPPPRFPLFVCFSFFSLAASFATINFCQRFVRIVCAHCGCCCFFCSFFFIQFVCICCCSCCCHWHWQIFSITFDYHCQLCVFMWIG